MRFIIRTIAAGAISIVAKIIIKKLQETDDQDATSSPYPAE